MAITLKEFKEKFLYAEILGALDSVISTGEPIKLPMIVVEDFIAAVEVKYLEQSIEFIENEYGEKYYFCSHAEFNGILISVGIDMMGGMLSIHLAEEHTKKFYYESEY